MHRDGVRINDQWVDIRGRRLPLSDFHELFVVHERANVGVAALAAAATAACTLGAMAIFTAVPVPPADIAPLDRTCSTRRPRMKAGTKPAEFACLPARHTDNHSVQRQLDALAGVHRNESAGGVPVAAIGLFRYQMTVSLIIGELLMIHATVVAIMVLALGVTARPLPAFAA